jgi:hypothetical protein
MMRTHRGHEGQTKIPATTPDRTSPHTSSLFITPALMGRLSGIEDTRAAPPAATSVTLVRLDIEMNTSQQALTVVTHLT